MSYAEFDARITDTAARLQGAGIEAGDVVGVMLADSTGLLITLFALARAGAVILPIDRKLTPREHDQAVAKHSVKAVIAKETSPDVKGMAMIRPKDICPPGGLDVAVMQSFQKPDLAPGHALFLVPSSGTTGAPKTFLWSHAQIEAATRQYVDIPGWTAEERYAALIGMTFFWGCEDCLASLRLGATVVIDRTQSYQDFIDFAERRCITTVSLTPAHLRRFLEQAGEKACVFPTVRSMIVGSAPLTPQERHLARQRLTPQILESYGTNEIGFATIANPADQDAHPESVGRVVAGLEAQIVDADDNPLPNGEIGQLRFRGPGVLTDRYQDPEASARAFRDGWYYPMDLAALNADGYLFLKGRSDDVINNEGAKFYPIEVETVLLAHPAVAEAAVFAWPHERVGQVAVAYLVTTESVTRAALKEHCKASLARHKLPGPIRFIDEMPRNPMGKILKIRLKELYREAISEESSVS